MSALSGTTQVIGLKSTRICNLVGLASWVTPGSPKLSAVSSKKPAESSDKLRFERARFTGFGKNSLDSKVMYIAKDARYSVHTDAQASRQPALNWFPRAPGH